LIVLGQRAGLARGDRGLRSLHEVDVHEDRYRLAAAVGEEQTVLAGD
jgi:hypothetical protein